MRVGNFRRDGDYITDISASYYDTSGMIPFNMYHPLEIESALLNKECVSNYLSNGNMYSVWMLSGKYYYIVNVTKKHIVTVTTSAESAERAILKLIIPKEQ